MNRPLHLALRSGIAVALLSCLVTAMPSAHGAANDTVETEAWRFRVMLDDKPIGHHDFVVRRTPAGEHVRIDAQFDVRFLRIPVYSYSHVNTESWRGGCLEQLDSRTDDNGEILKVNARRDGDEVLVESSGETRRVERACVQSFAYWNRDIVDSDMLLNAQSGEMVPVSIEPVRATTPREIPDLPAVDAYRIVSRDGEVNITVAYARNGGRWLYLESRLDGGRTLRYLPDDATVARAEAAAGERS